MPRNTPPSVPVADLPEFMRSRTVAAIVVETLDHAAENQLSGSMRDLVTGAAGELRSFHGLSGASADPQGIERPTTEGGLDDGPADRLVERDGAFS